MCFEERNTTSLGRPDEPDTLWRTRRCRWWRRSSRVLTLWVDRMTYLAAWAVLPALRRTCSPTYRIPLPLYGSGGRMARSSAATCPTSSLFTPSTFMTTLFSTEILIPFGAWYGTGCEKPTVTCTPNGFGSAL